MASPVACRDLCNTVGSKYRGLLAPGSVLSYVKNPGELSVLVSFGMIGAKLDSWCHVHDIVQRQLQVRSDMRCVWQHR